jgi:hypothetical protein
MTSDQARSQGGRMGARPSYLEQKIRNNSDFSRKVAIFSSKDRNLYSRVPPIGHASLPFEIPGYGTASDLYVVFDVYSGLRPRTTRPNYIVSDLGC